MSSILAFLANIQIYLLVAFFMAMTLQSKNKEKNRKELLIIKVGLILCVAEAIRFCLVWNVLAEIITFVVMAIVLGFCIKRFFEDSAEKLIVVYVVSILSLVYVTYWQTPITLQLALNLENLDLYCKLLYLFNREIFAGMAICLVCAIWKWKYDHQNVNVKYFILYIMFPVSRLLSINYANLEELRTSGAINVLMVIGCIVGEIADIFLMYSLLEQKNKEILKQRILEMNNNSELEREQQILLENLKKETSEIKQNLMAKLNDIDQAMKEKDVSKVNEKISQLSTRLANTKEKNYCSDPVINAVLTDKIHICEEKNIEVTIDIKVNTELVINPVDICSLYANLMDNAIRAVSVSETERRFIEIRSGMKGDYLTVKITNSADSISQKKDTSRKHYGQQIIDDIVTRYQGEWNGKWNKKENSYTAAVTILVQ